MPRTLLLLAVAAPLVLHVPVLAQERGQPRLDRFGDPLPAGALARLGTLRFHHCSRAAYSPDGKILATASSNEVILWEAATFKKIRRLAFEHKYRESQAGLVFSHDGKKLAAFGWAGDWAEVWDLATFDKLLAVEPYRSGDGWAQEDWSAAAVFSSDDKVLVAGSASEISQYDLASKKKVKQFPLRIREDEGLGVSLIAFSDDGKFAATQTPEKVQLWDAQTGALLHQVALVSKGGETLRFSRDGKLLIVPGRGRWMSIVSVETGKKIRSLPVAERVLSISFSADGKTMATASNVTPISSSTEGEQVIQLWDLGNLDAAPVTLQAPGIRTVLFAPDGKTLAWRSHEQVCFMDRATGKDLLPTASHRGAITSLLYIPDGKRIVSASEDGTIRTWDAATGEPLGVLEGHVCEVQGLALYPNGKRLASCGRDGTFRLWDLERGRSLAVLRDEGGSIAAAAFSADGKQLASGGHGHAIFLRDPATGKIEDELVDSHAISNLAFAPDGKSIAVVGHRFGNNELWIQDLIAKKSTHVPLEEAGVSSVAYSPDGKMLAVACFEALLLLDPASQQVLRTLPVRANERGCVVFSPDGRYLASVTNRGRRRKGDGSIHIFELASGTEMHSFKTTGPLFAAAFSPDGSKLAVGGDDATALILDLHNLSGKQRRRQLTEKELTAFWIRLTTPEAADACEIRADLLHAPLSSVPFLAKRLQPAPLAIDAGRVAELIKKLDSDAFRERHEAARELEQMGDLLREPMRKALAADPPPETRKRLQSLLGKLDHLSPAQLRNLRAIEILESIGTPEALAIVERLTKGNAVSHLTSESKAVLARLARRNAPLPPSPVASVAVVPPPGPVLPDLDGDPMPAGAIARLGSARWRLADAPRRIIVSPDGKKLAVVNASSGVELLDAQTGRSIERTHSESLWGYDPRMAVALSPDWKKVAAGSILEVFERGQAAPVKIDYARKETVLPEEIEASGRFSWSRREFLSATEFSPDGKTLVGSVRYELQVNFAKEATHEVKESHVIAWDASTGKEIWKSLAPAAGVIHTILFSPDGKTMTVADETGVGFWDFAAGREVRRWPSKEPLCCARWSPDRNWLAAGSKNEVLLWEAATGKVVRRLKLPAKEVKQDEPASDQIKAVAFSADGKLLAVGSDVTIRFFDPLTGEVIGDCGAFPNPVEAVAFSGDGKTLFSGHDQENMLRRWDVAGRKLFGELTGPITPLGMLSFSKDSRTIQATNTGDETYLWEAETGKPRPMPATKVDGFPGQWLASSTQASLLRCGEDVFTATAAMFRAARADGLDLFGIPGLIGSSSDGRRVLVLSERNKMPCLSVMKVGPRSKQGMAGVADKRQVDIEREFAWKIEGRFFVSLSPDGKTVAAAAGDVVCFFDVVGGKERRYAYPEPPFQAESIRFAADGSRIALAGSGGEIRILAVKDGRRLAEFAAKRNLRSLAFSPDGQTLLTASFNGPVCVWEAATGQMVRKLEPATYLFSPDNRLLAGSDLSGKGGLRLFDLYGGRILRECLVEGNAPGQFAFSPSSKLLAACCADTTIAVWPTTHSRAGNEPLDEKRLAEVLGKGKAAQAYEAIGQMIADPERALAFLERRLRPAAKVDARPDSDKEWTPLPAEDLLHIRAVQALERIGSKRAQQLLGALAQGAQASPRTQAALEALRRLR